jgi:hypothetical protein
MSKANKIEAMIERAYALAVQVMDDNKDEKVVQVLAEEVSGECGEFLALWNKDYGAFGDADCMDSELIELIAKLKGEKA